MSLVVGQNSWVTLQEADDYFATRIGADKYWDNSQNNKEKALVTAFRQLKVAYDLQADNTDENVKYAQCEQALFLIAFSDEIFRRTSLQAQGIVKAGLLKEDYSQDMLQEVPISVMAKKFLKDYEPVSESETGVSVKFIDLSRDEEEDYD